MFEGFQEVDFVTRGATIRVRHGGNPGGSPLVLLHGNPLTSASWHKIAPQLAERFYVVAPDLRGYGRSSAPEATEDYGNYSFRAMAQDQLEVMGQLGYTSFHAVGHDRGARVVHRLCLDAPQAVEQAAVLDILPTHHVWTNTSKDWAYKSWHWLFMAQPPDLPEGMMGAVSARWYMEKKIGKPGIGLRPFSEEALEEYIECFDEQTIRGSCNDYRATIGFDFEIDDADYGKRYVESPLLVLWGERSHTGSVWGDLVPIWQRYARDVRGHGLPCGHYVPEEEPDAVLKHLLEFLDP
ncbi:alpha/beta hydrolase [Egibacter rhizosphaerae]|uniref:Alpha/beta hydrolase n=1 Tax=Egibacter rhizosphaerae TaxID=1670831 RepID=A0A411YEH8_9ACTN|nr:alpha/beta hydrolase [Egibacter rhizosphaerae]QBI19601.1 alpha/beta hydrolase [Egibacter rhizosphaerae]